MSALGQLLEVPDDSSSSSADPSHQLFAGDLSEIPAAMRGLTENPKGRALAPACARFHVQRG